jgi:F-type H+-transporting ATPase subunit delta
MAETVTIARPYAEAAFKLAREKNALTQWSQMLEFIGVVVGDENVARAIGNPNVTRPQLESLLLGVLGDRVDGAARNFVQLLVQNGRLGLMPDIRALYERLKLEHEDLLEAQIHSAYEMDDAQVAQIVAGLENKYQRKVRAQVSVDPELIGGVRIVVGDKVMDATVRGRLEAMSAALTR